VQCAWQELEILEEDARVFKLIGPVLVRQELMEVKNNVTKRIEYIKNDMCARPPRQASQHPLGTLSAPSRHARRARAPRKTDGPAPAACAARIVAAQPTSPAACQSARH
jgi:hypothetical protein